MNKLRPRPRPQKLDVHPLRSRYMRYATGAQPRLTSHTYLARPQTTRIYSTEKHTRNEIARRARVAWALVNRELGAHGSRMGVSEAAHVQRTPVWGLAWPARACIPPHLGKRFSSADIGSDALAGKDGDEDELDRGWVRAGGASCGPMCSIYRGSDGVGMGSYIREPRWWGGAREEETEMVANSQQPAVWVPGNTRARDTHTHTEGSRELNEDSVRIQTSSEPPRKDAGSASRVVVGHRTG
ncbi:hypothetical protein DFH08DRAFT_944725 [Mycena albidolilacea]|uniref:Uncharacterized protein n=1 Tax=Mycena albidolilacea TaxID=1033008 RepID=A0AAD7EAD6_9AGAR|nr:hypothetical protein DFH08DRAFT_944725 [Mycena albidolilacea]